MYDFNNKMAALSLSLEAIKPLNRWDHSSIRPGAVGSVGGVNLTPRLKSTFPGDFNWDQTYANNNESLYGSSITDGQHRSYNSGGGPAHTIDSNWGGRRRFKTSHGWYYQDLVELPLRGEPRVGALPQYTWRNKIATCIASNTEGAQFQAIVPGSIEFPLNGVLRGGEFPRETNIVQGAIAPTNITQQQALVVAQQQQQMGLSVNSSAVGSRKSSISSSRPSLAGSSRSSMSL